MEDHLLDSLRHIFRGLRDLGRKALEPLSLEELQRSPGPGMNSIAVIVRHLHGNMLSRWTDFLTTDGEKPWRQRDSEFGPPAVGSPDEVRQQWDEGWSCLMNALEGLDSDDLMHTVTIRNQPHTVTEAVLRQLQHYAYHVGQIVQLARQWRGEDWEWLSVPPGKSRDYRPTGRSVGEPPLGDQKSTP